MTIEHGDNNLTVDVQALEIAALKAKLAVAVSEAGAALRSARNAIEIAITSEDGLDGGDGEIVIEAIDYALAKLRELEGK